MPSCSRCGVASATARYRCARSYGAARSSAGCAVADTPRALARGSYSQEMQSPWVLFRIAHFALRCARRTTETRAMSLREKLHHHRSAIGAIAAKHGASNVRLFGSVIRGDEGPDSDIDLHIDMDEDRGFTDYLALVEELEGLFGRRVDLIIGRSLSPHFRPYIEAEAQPL